MSVVIARILLAVGIGVVSAVAYTFYKERNREQHSHRGQQGGTRGTGYEGRPSWGSGDYPDDDDKKQKFRRRSSRTNETKTDTADEGDNNEPISVINSCPICLEKFRDLKRKEIPIYSTPCGHLFCRDCLIQAVRTNHACPSCRTRIVSFDSCHKIFL